MPAANSPITSDQAQDLLQYLINQLEVNGFGVIVSDINSKINEQLNEDITSDQATYEKSRLIDPVFQLIFFIDEAIESLKNISNDNFDNIIENLNKYITSDEGSIETIEVELLNPENKIILYDLRDLPSYNKTISILQQVRHEIRLG